MLLCDGKRGNVCGGSKYGELWKNQLVCGKNGQSKCKTIPDKCNEQPAFSLIKDKGWCHGKMGCGKLCTTAAVSIDKYNNAPTEFINARAKNNQVIDEETDKAFGFVCGCTKATDGKTCDSNFDGFFSGKCDDGKCKGDS